MKTRMRRFWISVSLAGSLALPLSGSLRAHDLPTRWTSGANSTPSWNHLLDDCLDSPSLAGPNSLGEVETSWRRGTEDWASSCPAELAAGFITAGTEATAHAGVSDHDQLWRNPISKFSKEMSCWVNEWEQLQRDSLVPATVESSPVAWAALPDAGNPPTPDWNAFVRTNAPAFSEPTSEAVSPDDTELIESAATTLVAQSDTCAYDAEYQARQTAADLLAIEINRAADIARNEQRLSQALSDAASVQAATDADVIASTDDASNVSALANGIAPLCGGETNEIISDSCFPNRLAPSRFAPGIVDEYMAYDLDPRDQHWLGGLGKSWKLQSALAGSRAVAMSTGAADIEADEWAIPTAELAGAPESFVAPDMTDRGQAVATDSDDTSALNAFLNRIVKQAQQSTLALLDGARASATPVSEAMPEVLPNLLPNMGDSLARLNEWIEMQQCAVSSELCGFENMYAAGRWLGNNTVGATQISFTQLVAMGHYLDLPVESRPDVYVVYIDADGTSIAVPSSLARAWNRPDPETIVTETTEPQTAEPVRDEFARDGSEEPAGEAFATVEPAHEVTTGPWLIVEELQTEVVTMLAKQLDSIGMSCLQAADGLNSWAQTQIASRATSDVR